jgi:hypothetical protein
MTSDNVNERPECEELLRDQNLWALKARDFVNLNEFRELEMDFTRFSNILFKPLLIKFTSQKKN